MSATSYRKNYLIFCLLTIFLFLSFSSLLAQQETILLPPTILPRTPTAQHTENGDEELKAYYKVHLTGSFTLAIRNGVLVGDIMVIFEEEDPGPKHKERGTDHSQFIRRHTYPIFSAKEGYKVVDFKIVHSVFLTSVLDFWGRVDGDQADVPSDGPLNAITWKGDSGSDQDQIHGCYVVPHLKRIMILTEKIK